MWEQSGRGRGLQSSPCTLPFCQGLSRPRQSELLLRGLTHTPTFSLQEHMMEAEPEQWLPPGVPKDRRDLKKSAKLPETPKTAEEMWQHSVIGDYLAKYRVRPTPP